MDIRNRETIVVFVYLSVLFGSTCVLRAQETELGRKFIQDSVEAGFATFPEIKKIEDLVNNGKDSEAIQQCTKLIRRPNGRFPSQRRAEFFKGIAFFLRGSIVARTGDADQALADFVKSAELGYRDAHYQVHAHSLIRIKQERSTDPLKDREASFHHCLSCAELASPVCIDQVQIPMRATGAKKQEHYWFLLERMTEDADSVLAFRDFFNRSFDDEDRKFFVRVMEQLSLSGGPTKSDGKSIPGRSVLTSAYLDYYMRQQLNFVWHAFFQTDAPDMPLREVFAGSRLLLREHSPIADLYLLVNKKYATEQAHEVLSAQQLVDRLLPGDQIVVRSRRLSHMATVWDINREKGTLRVLDPFHEYWDPTQNSTVTKMELVPYKHRRRLVNLQLKDLTKMMVAILTIRDRREAAASEIDRL